MTGPQFRSLQKDGDTLKRCYLKYTLQLNVQGALEESVLSCTHFSFTVCVLDLTACFHLGLQNLLENRGNAFGPVCHTAWANYLASVKQSKVVLLY